MKRCVIIGALLFLTMLAVFWKSIPHDFNTVYENKRFFDSDGEFIVRQYNEDKTFTHNDHILYHILGQAVHKHCGRIASLDGCVVRSHKFLSVFSGALGVVLLYAIGYHITKRHQISVMTAIFAGGCASWWFFSATIDTYLPCLCVSLAALGAAVRLINSPSIRSSILLGAMVGLAFLFRTDSILLTILGLSLFTSRKGLIARVTATTLAAIIVGVAGYFVLAHLFYDVAWQDVPAWAVGSIQRPEAADERSWGVIENITWGNVFKTWVNHTCYNVLLPGLGTTQNPNILKAYSFMGKLSLYAYTAATLAAIGFLLQQARANLKSHHFKELILPLLALLWIISRASFYAWWAPKDPFLFSVMSIPAIWILFLLGQQHAEQIVGESRKGRYSLYLAQAGIVVLVWVHNLNVMITPLHSL